MICKLLKRLLRKIPVLLIVISLLGAEVHARVEPKFEFRHWSWLKPEDIRYDPCEEAWTLDNRNIWIDSFIYREHDIQKMERMIESMRKPSKVPGQRKYSIKLKKLEAREPERFVADLMAIGMVGKRRLVLVNPDDNVGISATTRIHLHLGVLVVGTVAEQEGYEVLLWDEIIQGPINLAAVLKPGDILGLSLVVTGIERGVKLAYEAKQLGADFVLAGNDASAFRYPQLLALPGRPIDAVATTNSTDAIRQFFRLYNGVNTDELNIPGIKTRLDEAAPNNSQVQLKSEARARQNLRRLGQYNEEDGFIVPNFSLFSTAYKKQVWGEFEKVYGHKHKYPGPIRNATGHCAQGCPRTKDGVACIYCSIGGVGDVRVPSHAYIEALFAAYESEGITEFFNVTDSSFGMTKLLKIIEEVGFPFKALTMYARAHEVATRPDLLERWAKLPKSGRLQLNMGIDSGDERMLTLGVGKSPGQGSRLEENMEAILASVCMDVHVHFSVIIGWPDETHKSARRTVNLVHWTKSIDKGHNVDLVESDCFWVNHGAPVAQILSDYRYATNLASLAGKALSQDSWAREFWSQRNTLAVSNRAQRAWYRHFTHLTFDEAEGYNAEIAQIMDSHVGAVTGRAFMPR